MSDFAHGLDKMTIVLARSDCKKVFDFLDKTNTGEVTFAQFCSLVGENVHREIDSHKLKTIEVAIADKISKERAEFLERKQQESLERLSVSSTQYRGLNQVRSSDRRLKTQRLKAM